MKKMLKGTLVVVALAGFMGFSCAESSPKLHSALPVPDRVELHGPSHESGRHNGCVLEKENIWHDEHGNRHMDRIWCDRDGQRHVEHVY